MEVERIIQVAAFFWSGKLTKMISYVKVWTLPIQTYKSLNLRYDLVSWVEDNLSKDLEFFLLNFCPKQWEEASGHGSQAPSTHLPISVNDFKPIEHREKL